ncbi:MAG: uracil-DNA glycosylase [Archangium sp.]|nr:uracil-DNA glycosylase [Archangium sp.]
MTLASLHRRITRCTRCARLVAWRSEVAQVKRRAYRDETYWGKPVPGFGDPKARLVIVGLAPGAHGANRTGRIFTGDASGDFLYAALHRAGFANQPTSRRRDDGLVLDDCFITCPVRCVPPGNKPNPEEIRACEPFLREELGLLRPRVFLALGRLAWKAALDFLKWPPADFAHGAEVRPPGQAVTLLASFHVSQQNTQTGRLTPAMFDQVLGRVRSLLDAPVGSGG